MNPFRNTFFTDDQFRDLPCNAYHVPLAKGVCRNFRRPPDIYSPLKLQVKSS